MTDQTKSNPGFAALLLLVWIFPAYGQAGNPTIAVPPSVVIDATSKSGTALLQIQNSLKTPAQLSLTAGDLISKTTGRRIPARISFAKPMETTGSNIYTAPLPGNSVLYVKAIVSDMTEAGVAEADLINDTQKLGILRIENLRVPFDVGLQGIKPESPDVSFQLDQPTTLSLKNDDVMTYPVKWELSVHGKTLGNGVVVAVPAKGTRDITFTPDPAWFTSWFAGLFKDDVVDGRLSLQFVPLGVTPSIDDATRAIPLKVHLAYWDPRTREIGGGLIAFAVLLLGGLSSLALNISLPNQLRRVGIKADLNGLGRKISDLPIQIDSRARVMIAVERKRLSNIIASSKWYSPEFQTAMNQANESISKLNTRIDLLQQLHTSVGSFERLKERNVSPAAFEAIEETYERALQILQKREPQDTDIQAVQAYITSLEQQIAAIDEPDAKAKQALVDDAKTMRDEYVATGPLGSRPMCSTIRSELPGPFKDIEAPLPGPAQVTPERYADLNRTMYKLRLVGEFVKLYEGTGSPVFRTRMDGLRSAFVGALGFDGLDSLFAARDLIRQMRDGSFAQDIDAELLAKEPQFDVERDRGEVRIYEPTQLSVRFFKKALNNASARTGWACIWNFDHDGLTEKGWTVSHYFPEARVYNVSLSFQHPEGHFILDAAGKPLTILKPVLVKPAMTARFGTQAGLEATKLGIALFAAVLMLLSGARDQLMKLDIFPGLVAVFVLGFGADTIKNLLSARDAKPH